MKIISRFLTVGAVLLGATQLSSCGGGAINVPEGANMKLPVMDGGRATVGDAAMLAEINRFRAAKGLGAVTEDPRISDVAALHSADMASAGQLGHIGSNGSKYHERLEAAGLPHREAVFSAENVAFVPGGPKSVMDAWSKSAGHNQNLSKNIYTRVGIANVGNFWTVILSPPPGY